MIDFPWLGDLDLGRPSAPPRISLALAPTGIRCGFDRLAELAARARNATLMQESLRRIPFLRVPVTPTGHAHYRCVAFVEGPLAEAFARRDRCLEALRAAGVPGMDGSCSEIYRERFFGDRDFVPAAPLPVAHRLGATSLTFLVHQTIDESSMRRYAEAA